MVTSKSVVEDLFSHETPLLNRRECLAFTIILRSSAVMVTYLDAKSRAWLRSALEIEGDRCRVSVRFVMFSRFVGVLSNKVYVVLKSLFR